MARRRRKQEQLPGAESPLGYVSMVSEVPDSDLPLSDMVERTPDGGVSVQIEAEAPSDDQAEKDRELILGQFDSNLAEVLSEQEQSGIGQELRRLVEIDLEARKQWESRMLDGLEIIGMADIPDDAVAFEGAARVTYPGIAEAMVQFQSRAMEELMPSEGPVKAGVIGKPNEQLEDRAERVQDYMNYQLTEEDDEYFNETEMLLMALPYAGSAFRKVAPDPVTGRTRSRMVPAKDFIVPYFAASLRTSPRYTHRYTMPINVYKRAVEAGYFIDAEFSPGLTQGDSQNRELEDTSDDRTPAYDPEDTDLELYEMTIDWEFDEFDDPFTVDKKYRAPYVITFEWMTGRVVRIARCWEESDTSCQKDVWYSHYKFLPGFGFYGWGYLHLIGGLGRAASGALRLLLDGSMTSSIQGGFKSQDARIDGEIRLEPGVWKDIDMSAEELAKAFYTPPYKEPGPALFKTLEILIKGIERFASTTEAMVGEASNTGPVGTTVALIEQGSKIFSGIHKRIHAAARIEFKLIAKCNFRFMPEETYPFSVTGEEKGEANFQVDFDPKLIDIVPVSDPNIFSSVQRIALAQAGMQLVDQRPDLFPPDKARKAYKLMLKALRIPGSDDWLSETMVKRMDPVSENVALLNGHAINVFIEQDDEAHLAVHLQLEQEIMAMPPDMQEKAMPRLRAHQAAHVANALRKRVEQHVMRELGGVPLPPYDPNRPEEYEELPPDIEAQIARAAAGYAPPPAAPTGEAEQEQANEDMAASRKADREDMLAERAADREDAKAGRDEARKDAQTAAQLKRDGVLSDVDEPAPGPLGA